MLRAAAITAAVTHAAIAAVGGLVIAPGSPPAGTLAERAAHVAGHPELWVAAWCVPPIAALALLWLMVQLRHRLDPGGGDAGLTLAVHATVAGVAIEGVACAVAAAALPAFAERGDLTGFAAAERLVRLGTATFGNLPFTLGQALVVLALARRGAPRPVIGLGLLSALAGLAFVVAGAAAPAPAPVANGILLGGVTLFGAAVAGYARGLAPASAITP